MMSGSRIRSRRVGLASANAAGKPSSEGKKDGCSGISQRIDRRLNRRDIKDRAAPVDEKLRVVIGCEAILDFAALAAVCFEAEEGTEWQGGKREQKERGKKKDKSSDENSFRVVFLACGDLIQQNAGAV